MRQFIILSVSLIIVVLSGILQVKYLEDTSRYALADIEYTRNAIVNNNFELAKGHCKELDNTWENMKNVWSMFITHDEIDQIDEQVIKLKRYIETDNQEEAVLASNILTRNFIHVVSSQKLKTENIL